MRSKKYICALSLSLAVAACIFSNAVSASGNEYNSIEETENAEVIRVTEEIAERYQVCPEVLQALIFYESSNHRTVVSRWGDIGYMQVNPKWNKERMQELGVTDLTDAYDNILVGTDLLMELCEEYGDIALALTAYNKGRGAADKAETGMSGYAAKILELSEKLERLHGK